jgi:hypothetical protein
MQWLFRQATKETAIGDLARDVRADRSRRCQGRGIKTARALRQHLTAEHSPCPGALAALTAAETDYRLLYTSTEEVPA